MQEPWASIVQAGVGFATLVGLIALVLSGALITKRSHEAVVAAILAHLNGVAADRDGWKAQATAATTQMERLADALDARNRRDETYRRASDP